MLIVDCIVGMSTKHREVLRNKRSELLWCIHIDERFLSELLSDSVITRTMKEQIDVSNIISTQHNKGLLSVPLL